jgi:putative transposase
VLQQVASGLRVSDLCRQVGISAQTFWRWKNSYGGMLPSEAWLDKVMLQDVVQEDF